MKKSEDIRVVNLLQYVRLTGRESTTLGTINNTIFETHIVFSTIPLQIILTSKQGFNARIELQGAEYLIKSKCQSIHSVDLLKLSAIHSMLTRHDTENYDILKVIRACCNFQNKQLLEDFFQHNLPKMFSDFVKIFTNNNFLK